MNRFLSALISSTLICAGGCQSVGTRTEPHAETTTHLASAAGAGEAPAHGPASRPSARRVTPFLMFQDGRAEEAIHRYIEVFREGRVVFMIRYAENTVGAKVGSIQQAVFEVYGQRIMVTESPIKHPFDFTPAVSLFVDFDTGEELDRVFAALSEGGMVMMPPANYGFSRRFAFIQDRYGVSWQLNLPSE
jgi:predicted 3-demethylubiquinone-9 3-methyltransferase (glyoxalase superfamily)